jgi:hypothetical protein
MTSQINTNGIDVNYPIPGQNNNSQGFRDNFAQIRTNLNTASAEITDLQTKAVLKAALDNSVLNNDMANTLISNASIRSFRHTTYNLGNSLTGTILIDASRADYQYGTVSANTTFQFGGWAPTNTEQTITLRLNISNSSAVVSLPNACITTNDNYGTTLIENFELIGNTATFTAPANVTAVEFELSTTDCGNTISIFPVNRAFKSTQVIERDVPPTGINGDTNGAIAVSPQIGQVTITETANTPTVITANAAVMNGSTISGTTLTVGTLASGTIAVGMLLSGGSVAANTYIVSNLTGTGSGSTWVVSQSQTLSSTNLTGRTGIIGTTLTVGVQTSGTVQEGMILSGSGVTANTWIVENLSGTGTGSTWRVSTEQYAAPATINGNIDVMTCDSTAGFYRDMPIVFTGNVIGGVTAGTTYYVKEVADANSFTISSTPGGAMLTLTDNSTAYTRRALETYDTVNVIRLNTANDLVVDAPIVFTGTTFGGLEANTVYYVKAIDLGNANIIVSQTRVNGIAGSSVVLDDATGNCTATCYVGDDIWRRINLTSW